MGTVDVTQYKENVHIPKESFRYIIMNNNLSKKELRVMCYLLTTLNGYNSLRRLGTSRENDDPRNYTKVDVSVLARELEYSKEEVKLLIEGLKGHRIEIPILLMLTVGLRFSEMAGLRWQDINFNKNTITVNQVLFYEKGKISFKEPKTEGSVRTVSVPVELMTKLKKLKVKHNQYKLEGILEYDDIVCLNSKLTPLLSYPLLHAFRKLTKSIGIRCIRLHDLRHTHATMLVLAGVDFKTISNRLGHTDIKITLNRYSHVLDEMDRKASENISNIMFN